MLETLQTASRAGGKILTSYFGNKYQTSHKGHWRNIVTTADVESQKIIQQTIRDLMQKKGHKASNIGFIGEENLHTQGEYQFIIDPLDGTTNFACGLEYFTVSIACYRADQPVCGVIYLPVSDIIYFGVSGQGAYKRVKHKDTKLTINQAPLTAMTITAHLSSNPLVQEKMIRIVNRLAGKTLGIRHLGCVTMEQCYLVENIFGAVLNANHFIWDTAATQIIIEEAGASLTDWQGKRLEYNFDNPNQSYNSLGCHPADLKNLQKYLE